MSGDDLTLANLLAAKKALEATDPWPVEVPEWITHEPVRLSNFRGDILRINGKPVLVRRKP